MKITTNANGDIVIKELFSGAILETEEGNQLGVCMRDDTLEINVMPKGEHTGNWWVVNMQTGEIVKAGADKKTQSKVIPVSNEEVGVVTCTKCKCPQSPEFIQEDGICMNCVESN